MERDLQRERLREPARQCLQPLDDGPCVHAPDARRREAQRARAQVRRAFLDMLAAWLLELPERAEHRPRLLPYLLAALAAAAAAALQALGAQYEREHASELKARPGPGKKNCAPIGLRGMRFMLPCACLHQVVPSLAHAAAAALQALGM